MKKFLNENFFENNYNSLIRRINVLEDTVKFLSDSELKNQTQILKKIFKKTNKLEDIIAKSFALVREASRRKTGLRHYNVQLLGGLTLNDGKIAEMRTGEGKTLVATLPAYLNSLTEENVHIVTVNDYLTKRDYNSTRDIYQTLGINSGLIQEEFSIDQRQKNYNAHITYVTNSELGFDYLKDNLTFALKSRVLPKLNFCIIDEIDLVLLDEAQTPLIVSEEIDTDPEKYAAAAQLVKYLKINQDFEIDEKNQNVILTYEGNSKIAKILEINNLFDKSDQWITYILNALRAQSLFILNTHYIIQNKQVEIVDEFTGRTAKGRKWGDGLHQAVQAKENLFIESNTETTALITYQNLFLLYPKLAGMSGTAITSEVEFDKIFNLSIDKIETAKPNRRLDLPDLIYTNQFKKWRAVINETKLIKSKKQPILIGTKTIEQSEILSLTLKQLNIYHQVLNAKIKNTANESTIIALAGEIGTITIATNMAGRGTDIRLGGSLKFKISNKLSEIFVNSCVCLYKKKKLCPYFLIYKNLLKNVSQRFISYLFLLNKKNRFYKQQILNLFKYINLNYYNDFIIKFLLQELEFSENKILGLSNKYLRKQGGLFVIGTERNDSQRIDQQLRGRCGRQGEDGTSQFFLSLDDKLWRLYLNEKSNNLSGIDNKPLESEFISNLLNTAQDQLEEINFGMRKSLIDYDEPISCQRSIVYSERKDMLKTRSNIINKQLLTFSEQIISECINICLAKNTYRFTKLERRLNNLFGKNLRRQSNPRPFFTIQSLLYPSIDNYLINEQTNKPIKGFFQKLIAFFKYCIDNYRILFKSPKKIKMSLKKHFFQQIWLIYESKKINVRDSRATNVIRYSERDFYIECLDNLWQEHLYCSMLHRESVSWRSYGQLDPLYEYKRDMYSLYISKLQAFRQLIVFLSIRRIKI